MTQLTTPPSVSADRKTRPLGAIPTLLLLLPSAAFISALFLMSRWHENYSVGYSFYVGTTTGMASIVAVLVLLGMFKKRLHGDLAWRLILDIGAIGFTVGLIAILAMLFKDGTIAHPMVSLLVSPIVMVLSWANVMWVSKISANMWKFRNQSVYEPVTEDMLIRPGDLYGRAAFLFGNW